MPAAAIRKAPASPNGCRVDEESLKPGDGLRFAQLRSPFPGKRILLLVLSAALRSRPCPAGRKSRAGLALVRLWRRTGPGRPGGWRNVCCLREAVLCLYHQASLPDVGTPRAMRREGGLTGRGACGWCRSKRCCEREVGAAHVDIIADRNSLPASKNQFAPRSAG